MRVLRTSWRKDWCDIGYSAIIRASTSGVVSFSVFKHFGHNDPIQFTKCDGNHAIGVPLEAADVFLHGSVRFDECSNWHFDEQERVMLHGCSRQDIMAWSEAMARCWDWAVEILASRDEADS